MEDYLFQEGFPSGLIAEFETDIFLSQQHLQLQASSGWISFAAIDKKTEQVEALIHYHLENKVARSPLRSPYGSFVFSKNISTDRLSEFVDFTEQKLKDKGAKSVLIRNAPDAYNPENSRLLQTILLQLGYKIELKEVSTIIPISNNSFESIIQRSHKKKLKKCREGGFAFQFVSLDHLEEVYDFLKTVREEKNYTLSMSLDELKRTVNVFQSNYLLSVVKDNKKIIAANVSIRINSKTLYNFYHDHLNFYDAVSPVVMLNEGLYDYCQQQNFELLDLGTSTINGKPDEELITFKVRLGGQPISKFTFVKNLK